MTSRPAYDKDLRINEGVLVSPQSVQSLHSKQRFPFEEGFYETSWFQAGQQFDQLGCLKHVKFGVLLCTDAMFLEAARSYAQQGAAIILIPRATSGRIDDLWLSMLKAMALMTGCYICSSNRSTHNMTLTAEAQSFNGSGWIFDPNGQLLATTSSDHPIASVEIDLDLVAYRKTQFPCYVKP